MTSPSVATALKLVGALVVVGGSFWGTLTYLNSHDRHNATGSNAQNVVELRPDHWQANLKAGYELKDGNVVMHGPGDIYAEAACPVAQCDVDFTVDVQHADAASVALRFLNSAGTPIVAPVGHEISGMKSQQADVRASSPPGAKNVQAFIYAPKPTDVVVFANPLIRLRPAPN